MKHEPGMAYDTKKLNKIFAILSIVFLMSVIWMMFDDFIRPWKAVQIKALDIERETLEKKYESELKALGGVEKYDELIKARDAAEAAMEKAGKDIQEQKDLIAKIGGEIHAEKLTKGFYNSAVSATTFNYEIALDHGDPKHKNLKKKLDEYKVGFSASADKLKALEKQEKEAKRKLNDMNKEHIATMKNHSKVAGALERLKVAIGKTEFKKNPIWFVRNAPFLDFLDPTLKIRQVVAKNITDDRYFQHVPKVDRCMTCHTFIDQKGYEDQPNPYKTHPKLDQFVGLNSPHPIKEFGCTTCHGGEGHRVHDFQSIAHTPRDAKQRKEWEEKYNWHPPHKVPYPMFRLQDTEASCVKCHSATHWIPKGTVVNRGRRLIEENGCYACHTIEGWEHLVKPGPSLRKISSKVSKEFFKNWVWNPHGFNHASKMPNFFNQSNNSRADFAEKNVVEVNAIAEKIWELAKPYKPFMTYTGGNAERGKNLIGSVGCVACHQVEGIENSIKVGARRGSYLTGTGSKVTANWLISWLKKPSHYQSDTIMPSFRLSNKEANDITAYLMSLKNQKFAALKFEKMNKQIRDELLLGYFSQFKTSEDAKRQLQSMSDRERTLELGHRSIGKYGCYSCHDIDTYEGRAPIGPNLTKWGSKPITQLGFGHEKIEHTREAWLEAHLENPRRWDQGTDKSFNDLNRMPNFYLKKEDIKEITTALLGQVSDYIPMAGKKNLDQHEALAAEGYKVINKFNCMGCHRVNGERGDILAMYEDDINEGPPRLNTEGHRVQADWLHYFLGNVFTIRPWLKVRMPSYELTNDDKNLIVSHFQHTDRVQTFEEIPKKVTWLKGERAAAQKLWNALACTSCHAGGFTRGEELAPNLKHAKVRLRPSWIKRWLRNPQIIMPGTSMPSFWEDGESQEPGILGGDSEKQIEAITKYIIEMGEDEYQKPLPKL